MRIKKLKTINEPARKIIREIIDKNSSMTTDNDGRIIHILLTFSISRIDLNFGQIFKFTTVKLKILKMVTHRKKKYQT